MCKDTFYTPFILLIAVWLFAMLYENSSEIKAKTKEIKRLVSELEIAEKKLQLYNIILE